MFTDCCPFFLVISIHLHWARSFMTYTCFKPSCLLCKTHFHSCLVNSGYHIQYSSLATEIVGRACWQYLSAWKYQGSYSNRGLIWAVRLHTETSGCPWGGTIYIPLPFLVLWVCVTSNLRANHTGTTVWGTCSYFLSHGMKKFFNTKNYLLICVQFIEQRFDMSLT